MKENNKRRRQLLAGGAAATLLAALPLSSQKTHARNNQLSQKRLSV